jgi:hypothetical protein
MVALYVNHLEILSTTSQVEVVLNFGRSIITRESGKYYLASSYRKRWVRMRSPRLSNQMIASPTHSFARSPER